MEKPDKKELNTKQYRKLIKVQRDAYRKILNYCIINMKDSEKTELIKKYAETIDKAIIDELKNINIDDKKYINV